MRIAGALLRQPDMRNCMVKCMIEELEMSSRLAIMMI
jgi:hypothetical protein